MAGWIGRLIAKSAETIVYWAPLPGSDSQGRPLFDAPVEIQARWQDSIIQFINQKGEAQVSRAQVFPVENDLALRGWVWRGAKSSIPAVNLRRPFVIAGACEIASWMKVPDITKNDYLRKAIV